ncbi:MAG: type I-E CRISPR-associated protein Cse2/CasB [Sulfuricella sp.]|nr:type I-E CRISPR-associated protein Cse2/CasB [Sulfuricella sp.]
MSLHDADRAESAAIPEAVKNPLVRLAQFIARQPRFAGDAATLDRGERAALARLDPDGEFRPHQVAALVRAFVAADLEPESWTAETWRRWALIAHGMALAGHDGGISLGQQLSDAAVAESRVTKLLTARGEAFRQLLPRLVRLLATKTVAPNWRELGGLILAEGRDEDKCEALRLKIAGRYFYAQAKKPKHA